MNREFVNLLRTFAAGATLLAPGVAIGSGEILPRPTSAEGTTWAPPLPISLDRAESLAVAANPSLAGMEASRRAADGTLVQARALPNPALLLESENFGLDLPGWDGVELTLSLAQPIETGGKRARRVAEAEAMQKVARLERDGVGLELRAEVRRRFIEALGWQERIRVLQDNVEIAEQTLNAVRELVRAGEVSPIEELKVDADASTARTDLANGEAELIVARGRLAALWGGAETEFGPLQGALSIPKAAPSVSKLLSLIQASPNLTRWIAEEERQAAVLNLQKALAWPDVTVSAGIRRFELSEENALVAAVALPLPLFDRRKGAIAEATARRDRASLQRQAELNRLQSEAHSAASRLNAASAEASRLQEDVLPKVRQVYESVEEGYRRGKFRLLDLLDARRSLTAAVLRYNDALIAAGLATADLYLLSGGSPDPGAGERP
jgi:cobalt-zinc-cadmium efflux system outer membrane protein